jgi:hypothetical protein
VLSELVSRNRGSFLLSSGRASLLGFRRSGKLWLTPYAHRPWKGTIVSVIIDLHSPLPLREVYSSMPVPAGFEDEEFFQDG